MWTCEKCGELKLPMTKVCHCQPFYIVSDEGESKIYAGNEEQAALKYAEKYNENGDYSLMNETMDIEVDGVPYKIGAEPDIHYRANKIEVEDR